jgi:hypothetical protein
MSEIKSEHHSSQILLSTYVSLHMLCQFHVLNCCSLIECSQLGMERFKILKDTSYQLDLHKHATHVLHNYYHGKYSKL